LLPKFDKGNAVKALARDPDLNSMMRPLLSKTGNITIGVVTEGKNKPIDLPRSSYCLSFLDLFSKLGYGPELVEFKPIRLSADMEMKDEIDTLDIILVVGIDDWSQDLIGVFQKETNRDPTGHTGIISYIQGRVCYGHLQYWGICGGAMAAGQKLMATWKQEWLQGHGPDGFRVVPGLSINYDASIASNTSPPYSPPGQVKMTSCCGLIVRISPTHKVLKSFSVAGKHKTAWAEWAQNYNNWIGANVMDTLAISQTSYHHVPASAAESMSMPIHDWQAIMSDGRQLHRKSGEVVAHHSRAAATASGSSASAPTSAAPGAAPGAEAEAAQLFHLLDKKWVDDSCDQAAATLVQGCNPKHVNKMQTLDKRQTTPLQLAAKHGCEKTVQALLHAGADPDKGDGLWGRTPFWEAASFGHVALLKRLLDARANPNRTPTGGPSAGWTPLDMAKSRKRHDAEVYLCSLEAW
jgi:hypothetical protein